MMRNNWDKSERTEMPSALTACTRFETLLAQPLDQLSDADFEFAMEHVDSCALGIHTEAALDRVESMSREEILAKVFGGNH
jgi:hypothetical protein